MNLSIDARVLMVLSFIGKDMETTQYFDRGQPPNGRLCKRLEFLVSDCER